MENRLAEIFLRALAVLLGLAGGIIVLTGTLLFATPFLLLDPGADFTGAYVDVSLFGFQIVSYPWPAHPTVLQIWGIPALATLKLWGLGAALLLGAAVLWTVSGAGTPFVPAVVHRLQAAAGCLLCYQFIFCWQYWWTGPAGAFNWPFAVLSVLFCLLAPALVLCLAGFVARGCALQQQADETL